MTSLLMNVCRKTCQVTPSSFAAVTASSNHERGLTSECKRPRAGFGFSIESTLFTTKDVGKGVGLGLSLSRTIIEERGKLELSEKAGHPSFSISRRGIFTAMKFQSFQSLPLRGCNRGVVMNLYSGI